VIATIIGIWSAVGAPDRYESKATLWFDTPVPAESSITSTDPGAIPPAQLQQQLLSQLLSTHAFNLRVARRGKLEALLEGGSRDGWGPLSLIRRLGGDGSIQDRIDRALSGKNLQLTVLGPQLLEVAFRTSDPAVAKSTLDALITQFRLRRNSLFALRASERVSLAQKRVEVRTVALTRSKAALRPFASQVPIGPIGAALSTQVDRAVADLNEAQSELDDALIQQKEGAVVASAVLDRPELPTGTITGKKRVLLVILGSLLFGAALSAAALYGLARRELVRPAAAYAPSGVPARSGVEQAVDGPKLDGSEEATFEGL
jgi:hypothetical protein